MRFNFTQRRQVNVVVTPDVTTKGLQKRPSTGQLLHQVWHQQSENPFGEPSLVEKVVLTGMILAAGISFRGVCARLGNRRVAATEVYLFSVLVLLTTLSFQSQLSSVLTFGILAYLVYEIVGWTTFDIFVESKVVQLYGRRSDLRCFVYAVYSYLVLAWAYGIFFWSTEQIIDSKGNPLPSAAAGLYYSIVTITTIGYGDYTPTKDASLLQLVVISEPLVGILILVLYTALLVSALADTFRKSIED